MLASRILAGPADEYENRASDRDQAKAEARAYRRALHGSITRRTRHHGTVVVTTTKDAGTSSQISASGFAGLSGTQVICAAELDLMTAAMDQLNEGPFVRYLQAVQGLVEPVPVAEEWAIVRAALEQNVAVLGASDTKEAAQHSWLEEARQELTETLDEGAEPDAEKREMMFGLGAAALEQAAKAGVDAPAIDIDHQGNLHLFWKKGGEGLLVVIRADRTIHFFGNSKGESFSSNYGLSGKTWRSHLNFYLQPLREDAAA